MKTTEILKSETPNRSMKQCASLKPVKRLLAASVGAVLAICATMTADAQTTTTCPPIGWLKIANITTQLLTTTLTTAQRQALHAKNFNQLPASQRALYLHAVAFDVGIMVGSGGQTLSSAALAEYLQSASMSAWPDDWLTPALLAHKTVVKTAMLELNMLIASQVSSNTAYQLAMDSGAVCSFLSLWDLSC